MNNMMLPWLGGMFLVSWRYIRQHSPPPPGMLAVASGAFAICALVSEANGTLGSLLAWGLDSAALLVMLSNPTSGPGAGLLQATAVQTAAATGSLSSSSTSATTSTGNRIADSYNPPAASSSTTGINSRGGVGSSQYGPNPS